MAFEDYNESPVYVRPVAEIGKRWIPRFFCDDDTTVYTSKPPVAKLDIPPVVFVNDTVAYKTSESRHATGTIDTFDLDFGGPTNTGDITNGNWSTSPDGNIQYTAIGEYEAELIVTDTLGLNSQPARVKVIVIDPSNIRADRLYIATDDEGLWIFENGDTQPSQYNTGLTGGHLNLVSGRLNPYTRFNPKTSHHYWAATQGGVIYSTDGCATWNIINSADLPNPTNTANDANPPTTTDLQQHCIVFHPTNPQIVYLLRSTNAAWNASNASRVYWYFSTDYGQTWESKGIGG